MSQKTAISLLALAVQASSGTGSTVDLGVATTARLWLEVTAGTGSLAVTIEHSHNATTWSVLGGFTAAVAPGAEYIVFPGTRRMIRAKWTSSGGPFTFGVTGESVQVYATPADIRLLGFPVPPTITDTQLDAAAEAASDMFDGYFRTADIPLPLTSWGNDIRRNAAIVAGYDLVSVPVGYNPEAPGDDPWRKRYEDVLDWLERLADNPVLGPGSGGSGAGRALVTTGTLRGW